MLAVVVVVGMAAHTSVDALVDGFVAFFQDVHTWVDASMVGIGGVGLKGARVLNLAEF